MKKDKLYIEGNELIHIYMGWEYLTPLDIFNYCVSPNRVGREDMDVVEYAKRNSKNSPNLKRQGSMIISTIPDDNICYSDHLNYHYSLDALLPVVEKLSKEYYEINNTLETIRCLMSESNMSLSAENLWERIVGLIKIINK